MAKNPIRTFETFVAEYQAEGMAKHQAVQAVARQFPKLRASYITAYNERLAQKRRKHDDRPTARTMNQAEVDRDRDLRFLGQKP